MGYWLKLYTDILDDPKYFKLSDRAKLGMYEIYLVAKKVENGETTGQLPSLDEIAFYTRKSIEWWQPVIQELINLEIISDDGHVIKNFIKRQEAIPDSERSKQYRVRCNAAVMNGDTQPSRELTFRDGEKNKNKNTEVEVDPAIGSKFAAVFVEETHIPELTGGVYRWTDAIRKLIAAKVTPEDLKAGIHACQDKGYSIVGLHSVLILPLWPCKNRLKSGKRDGPIKTVLPPRAR